MKCPSAILIIGVTVLCSTFCSAQHCADNFNAVDVHCVYRTCDRQIDVWIPNENGYGSMGIGCDSEDCCGQLVTTCFPSGPCENAKRAGVTAGMLKHLAQLSPESDFLVASCNGHYEPFRSTPPKIGRPASLALLNDHVLR